MTIRAHADRDRDLDHDLDHDLARLERALLARLPALLDEVAAGLATDWPDYADFLSTDRDGVAEAAGVFVRRLVEVADPATGPPGGPDRPTGQGDHTLQLVFETIGRQQLHGGHELTRVLTAFQLGARVAWRHVSDVALELDLPPTSLATLADSVFGFVNRLSFSAARGYVQAQVDDARTQERNREELAELLLSGHASASAVRAAAARAGWPVPEHAVLVEVPVDDDEARRRIDRLAAQGLPVRGAERYGVVLAHDRSAAGRERLRRQLQHVHAVVGYPVPPERLDRTLEGTRIAVGLRRSGHLHGDPVFVEDHLDTLIVSRDPALLEVLRRQVLGPLDGLGAAAHQRMIDTLRSWLRHQGDVQRVAEELCIHPQTVRYRMAQLRERFGEALDSPRERARLLLVLAWPLPD